MSDTAIHIELVKAVDVLHPDWPDGLDWRRCALTLTRSGAQTDAFLSVHVRGKSRGADAHHLFHCPAFAACLQRVALDIVEDTPLAAAIPENPITDPGSRSYICSGQGARLTYNLGRNAGDALAALSAHDIRALQRAGHRVAAREATRRGG